MTRALVLSPDDEQGPFNAAVPNYFEQIPVEVVKKIAEGDGSTDENEPIPRKTNRVPATITGISARPSRKSPWRSTIRSLTKNSTR
jgi:hypothetical protein